MKNKWSNYALKDGKVQSSYIREYSNRSPKRQAREASRSNRLLESRKEQVKEEVKFIYKPPVSIPDRIKIDPKILEDTYVIDLRGKEKENENEESKTGIGSPIQSSGEISGEVRSIKPSSSSSSSGNEKVRKRKDGKDGKSREKEG